jgi:quercetin dioxygenase-like cupin family protein
MPGYAIKNLMEIDDLAEAPDREIRFSRKYLGSEQLGVTYERFGPDYVSSDGHHHESQEEAYVVISGSGRVKLDDEVVELRQWDVVRVAPEVVRGFDAGPDGLELIAIGGEKPEGGDGVPVRDRWPAE